MYFILETSFWGACLIVLLLLFNKVFHQKLPSCWHYYIWIIPLIRLLVPVFFTVSVESKTPFTMPVNEKTYVEYQKESDAKTGLSDETSSIKTTNSDGLEEIMTNRHWLIAYITRKSLCAIWISVVLIIGFWKGTAYLLFKKKILMKSRDIPDQYKPILLRQVESLRLKAKFRVYINDEADSPFAFGLLFPKIILPEREYTDTELKYIFRHELTHIKNHDLLFTWLYEVAKVIHWFNPMLYLAARSLYFHREVFCDEQVIRNVPIEERKEYSMTIVSVISRAIHSKTSMCVSMHSSQSNIKKRISFILNNHYRKISVPFMLMVTIIAILISACTNIKYQEKGYGSIEKDIHILVVGVDGTGDKNARADVLMVVNYDAEGNKIDVISIPRDTYITLSEETFSELSAHSAMEIPKDMKVSNLMTYANGNMDVLGKEIGYLLNVPINDYVKIDMPAFKKMIDAIGGVELNVPQRMVYYDPTQNLTIDLQMGDQLLNGDMALQLVRYRGYIHGDIDRIRLQQELLSALYQKMIEGNNQLEKILVMFDILIKNTETSITAKDIMGYEEYIKKTESDGLTFSIIQ